MFRNERHGAGQMDLLTGFLQGGAGQVKSSGAAPREAGLDPLPLQTNLAIPVLPVEQFQAPGAPSSGFPWGTAAKVGGAGLGLLALGALVKRVLGRKAAP